MAQPAPRYIGSLTDVHGDVVDVRACVLPCCVELPEWEHPHASLTVYPDAGGSAVRLDRVRFASFTGRP
jgi:hypothetical protein